MSSEDKNKNKNKRENEVKKTTERKHSSTQEEDQA